MVDSTIHDRAGDRARWIVYSQLGVTMLIWGVAWPVGRLLADDLPPISIAAIRYAIVVPVLFIILYLKEHEIGIPRAWAGRLLLLGLLSTTLYQAFFLFGVRFAAASDDSLVIGVGPVLIAVLASVFAKEQLTGRKSLGFVLGLVGVGVISALSPNTDVPNRLLGVTLVFGGAVAYASYTVLLRLFISQNAIESGQTNPGPRQASSLLIVTWISLLGWLVLIPFSLLEAPWGYVWDQAAWSGILYLAILSTVIGYFFYIEGVSKIGASRAAIFGNLVPVFGVLSSFLLLGELVSVWHGVSFALIFLGVYLVNSQ